MALIGNCINVVYTEHETETQKQTITYPDGTTEEIEVPVRVKNETSYEDVYLCIKQVENFNVTNGDSYDKYIYFQYAAYKDKETRQADQEDFLFWVADNLQTPLDHSKTLYEQVYEYIKSKEGLTELQND